MILECRAFWFCFLFFFFFFFRLTKLFLVFFASFAFAFAFLSTWVFNIYNIVQNMFSMCCCKKRTRVGGAHGQQPSLIFVSFISIYPPLVIDYLLGKSLNPTVRDTATV